MSLLPDGKVRLKLRKPFYTGQTDILFEPVKFLKRLAAAMPKPRQHMIRFHGIFAPNAKHRADLNSRCRPPSKNRCSDYKTKRPTHRRTRPRPRIAAGGRN